MFTLLIKICFITFDRRIRESKKNRCISISISFFFIREVFKFDESHLPWPFDKICNDISRCFQ